TFQPKSLIIHSFLLWLHGILPRTVGARLPVPSPLTIIRDGSFRQSMRRLRNLFEVRPGELRPALLMFGFFFSVIAVFQILKPLKKGLFVAQFGAEHELIAKGINIDMAFTAMILFTYLYNWLGRQRLVRFLVGFFFLLLLVFLPVLND